MKTLRWSELKLGMYVVLIKTTAEHSICKRKVGQVSRFKIRENKITFPFDTGDHYEFNESDRKKEKYRLATKKEISDAKARQAMREL